MNFQDQPQPFQSQIKDQQNHQFQDENRPKDFSSVEKYVNLPQLRKVQSYENVFPPVEEELKTSASLSPELKQTMIDLRDKLRNQFSTYENSKNFKFTFPESKFPPVEPGKRNLITYEQKNIVEEEDTFRDKLSPEQIQQISQNGEFKVRSNHEFITLPYVWKVNDSIFKGKQNIELAWCKNIAWAHSILNNAKTLLVKEVPKEIEKIKKLPMRVFSLFFGKKSMQTNYNINYEREVGKDFWDEMMSKHHEKSKEWGSELWEYLDTKMKAEDWMSIRKTQFVDEDEQDEETLRIYNKKVKEQSESREKYNKRVQESNEKKERIAKVGDEFERRWVKGKKKVFEQVSAEYQKQQQNTQNQEPANNESEQLLKNKQKLSEEQILQRFNSKKFQNYTLYLRKRLPKLDIPTGVIEAIITMLTLMQIMTRKQRKFDQRLKEEKQKMEAKIKEEHKIKQYDYRWYEGELAGRYEPVKEKLTEQYMNKLVDVELIKRLTMKQREVYNLWLEYRAKYPALMQAKRKQLPQLQQPSRIFYSTYLLFPPYKILKHKQNNCNWYEMIREAKLHISTDKHFWKLDLYLMRLKSWTINCLVFLIFNSWKGLFGLRCLWGLTPFTYDQAVNYSTGEIIDLERKPVLAVFNTVLEGVTKSRQHFEGLPDRGLFGKNFSRIFNYAQCYIFRFLFVGVILTLIFYPIAIVCLSVLIFVMVLTVWAWMPIVLLVTYLFNTLFFQFQSSWIPYGFFVRAAPMPSLVLNLIWSLCKIILILIYTFLLSPLGAFFVTLWACFIRGFRTVSDTVMLFFIRKLGRTPSRNTAIAKKISGPGMSKQFYMSINEEDVYILVQSQLEQIFMRQYNRIFNQKVNEPVSRFSQVMRLLLSPLQSNNSYYYPSQQQNVITQSVNDLQSTYQSQYQNYMNRYPTRPYNIRFTQEELDSYFQNTVMIVKNFVSKNEIFSWVFDEYHILEDYEELTRKIWMAVFSCGEETFQPLEKIDMRFKLQDMYKSSNQNLDDDFNTSFAGGSMKKNVHKVMEALEGQVQLKPRRAHLNAFKHNLMTRELSAVGVRQVFSYMNSNADGAVHFDRENPKYVFYVNLAIKEIIKREKHLYEWKKEEAEKARKQRR